MTTARDTLRVALNPKSVAIVGASNDPDKIGGRADTLAAGPLAGSATAAAEQEQTAFNVLGKDQILDHSS